MNSFIPIFKKYYSDISSGNELVNINYKSDLNSGSFSEILNESFVHGYAKEKKSKISRTTFRGSILGVFAVILIQINKQ